jgi:hypothetical protein
MEHTYNLRDGSITEEPDEGKLHVRFCVGALESLLWLNIVTLFISKEKRKQGTQSIPKEGMKASTRQISDLRSERQQKT